MSDLEDLSMIHDEADLGLLQNAAPDEAERGFAGSRFDNGRTRLPGLPLPLKPFTDVFAPTDPLTPRRSTMTDLATPTAHVARELTDDELADAAGGLKIGPLSIESGSGLVAITVGGYGVWGGQGCVGVLTPERVLGACVR